MILNKVLKHYHGEGTLKGKEMCGEHGIAQVLLFRRLKPADYKKGGCKQSVGLQHIRGVRGAQGVLCPPATPLLTVQQPPHLHVCTLDNLSTVWTQLPFGSKGRAREGKKLRTHTAFFKLYCLQNTLSVAFSVARHYHKPFIANHLSWSTIRVINILNGVNLFWRRIVVTTCMISSEILFKLAPKGLQTIIKVHQDTEGIFSKYID